MMENTTVIVKKKDAILAWHWLPDNGKLAHAPHTLVKAGQTVKVKTPVVICENGLHASVKALDALKYAPGAKIERVLCWGEVIQQEDKLAAQYRKCLWVADATRTLHELAIWNAKNALELAKVDDERCWNALKVKEQWLDGNATDAELAAARNAAWDAARNAARAAAWDAARDAAWNAAWDAAWDAARDAARAAAWDAARDAARNAAWDAAWNAARAAAWNAARNAARAAANSELEQRLERLKP
jgi:hypothetical protein